MFALSGYGRTTVRYFGSSGPGEGVRGLWGIVQDLSGIQQNKERWKTVVGREGVQDATRRWSRVAASRAGGLAAISAAGF